MSKSLLDRVQIQTPCQTDWGSMQGDDRVRHCAHCDKHVYNLSQMTRQQAEALLAKTNGNLCARFEQRPDGSILTNDPSFGLPRFQTRFLRLASAMMSAALSLSPSIAAKSPRNLPVLQQQDKQAKPTEQTQEKGKSSRIYGTVVDKTGAVIPGAAITAIEETTKQVWKTISSADGEYEFLLPSEGSYALTFEPQGFKKLVRSGLNIKDSVSVNFTATMEVGEANIGVVVIVEPPVPTAVPDKDLKLELTPPLQPNAGDAVDPDKKRKKSLLDALLAPIKKISSDEKDK
jgi:hypothetical protein